MAFDLRINSLSDVSDDSVKISQVNECAHYIMSAGDFRIREPTAADVLIDAGNTVLCCLLTEIAVESERQQVLQSATDFIRPPVAGLKAFNQQ
jgi:hypothetical protein